MILLCGGGLASAFASPWSNLKTVFGREREDEVRAQPLIVHSDMYKRHQETDIEAVGNAIGCRQGKNLDADIEVDIDANNVILELLAHVRKAYNVWIVPGSHPSYWLHGVLPAVENTTHGTRLHELLANCLKDG
jgi:hypothetical protein